MKVAIITDFLTYWGGSEQVFYTLHKMFPDSQVLCLFYDKRFVQKFFPNINIRKIRTSFLHKIPGISKIFNLFLPILPLIIESIDLEDFDIILSVTSSFVKGVITSEKQIHICYLNTPARFLWQEKYDNNIFTTFLFKYLREWDYLFSQRPDYIIANSDYSSKRIFKYYKRKADLIIYPPLRISNVPFVIKNNKKESKFDRNKDYFITVSHLSRYKNIDLAINIFNKLGYKYYIVGEGKFRSVLEKKSKKNIKFFGFLKEKEKNKLLKNAFAFIFPTEDDFGLAPVEALSLGVPVLGFNWGGSNDWLKEGVNGYFFKNDKDLQKKIELLINTRIRFSREKIIGSVLRFKEENFIENFRQFLNKKICSN